jgi:hypothetical protein
MVKGKFYDQPPIPGHFHISMWDWWFLQFDNQWKGLFE